ncbi:MAG: polysaccharide pyruvyl transferase CsaB [Firmicutes bacterium]|nr:polysaccharide pyruvyl transferase CsaB [Bacillota bacterium]
MNKTPMNHIIISGYYGFGNLGDEALLTALLQIFSSLWPHARFTVLSGDPQRTSSEHGVSAVSRSDFRTLRALLKQPDTAFISGGGTLFQDVTSSRSLYYYLSLLLLCHRYNVPTVVYGQGVGPFRHSWNRYLTGLVLKQVKLMVVRETEAYNSVLQWGFVNQKQLVLGADPVLALKSLVKEGPNLREELGLSEKPQDKVLLVCPRPGSGLSANLKLIAACLDEIMHKGWQVVLLPFQYDLDYPICRQIADSMDNAPAVWDKPLTVEEALLLVGQADYCLGMRLHSLVFAGLWGIPMVGLVYDPKVENFLRELGLEKFAFPLNRVWDIGVPERLLAVLMHIAQDEQAIKTQIQVKVSALKKRLERANSKLTLSLTHIAGEGK